MNPPILTPRVTLALCLAVALAAASGSATALLPLAPSDPPVLTAAPLDVDRVRFLSDLTTKSDVDLANGQTVQQLSLSAGGAYQPNEFLLFHAVADMVGTLGHDDRGIRSGSVGPGALRGALETFVWSSDAYFKTHRLSLRFGAAVPQLVPLPDWATATTTTSVTPLPTGLQPSLGALVLDLGVQYRFADGPWRARTLLSTSAASPNLMGHRLGLQFQLDGEAWRDVGDRVAVGVVGVTRLAGGSVLGPADIAFTRVGGGFQSAGGVGVSFKPAPRVTLVARGLLPLYLSRAVVDGVPSQREGAAVMVGVNVDGY